MSTMLSHTGKQLASECAYGNSHELLSSMCYRDDDHKTQQEEMQLICSSIKTIGPKNQPVLVQIPSASEVKSMIRDRVRKAWKDDSKSRIESKYVF